MSDFVDPSTLSGFFAPEEYVEECPVCHRMVPEDCLVCVDNFIYVCDVCAEEEEEPS